VKSSELSTVHIIRCKHAVQWGRFMLKRVMLVWIGYPFMNLVMCRYIEISTTSIHRIVLHCISLSNWAYWNFLNIAILSLRDCVSGFLNTEGRQVSKLTWQNGRIAGSQNCRPSNSLQEWLGSRVASVLDSGAVEPGFKSQPRRCRITVLGKLFTPIVPLFIKQRNL